MNRRGGMQMRLTTQITTRVATASHVMGLTLRGRIRGAWYRADTSVRFNTDAALQNACARNGGSAKPVGRGMKFWKREGDYGRTRWVQHRITSGRYSCASGVAILHYSLLSIPRPTGSGGSTLSDAVLGTLSSLKLQSARTAPIFCMRNPQRRKEIEASR